MQSIYNYLSGTNHISRVYSVAGVLYLQFVLYVLLLHTLNTCCTFTLVYSQVCVQCSIWLFIVVSGFRVFRYVAQVNEF